jgi:predicted nucleotidyltransferase
MTLDSNEKKFIVEAVRKFFSDPNDKILLFGSYAKGVARPSSDIDIAIKSQNPLPVQLNLFPHLCKTLRHRSGVVQQNHR